MGPVLDEERPVIRSVVSVVRDRLDHLPDVRPERVARGRALLAAGLPTAEDLAGSIIECERRERLFH